MAIVIKPIKASRLNVDAFRLAFLTEMNRVISGMLADFNATVSTWDEKPKFQALKGLGNNSGGAAVIVGTDDEIYKFVDEGTVAHRIPKTGFANLRFQPKYTAKSAPFMLGSRSGGPSGSYVFRRTTFVKGIKARKFTDVIRKKWQPIFTARMDQAIKREVKKQGAGKQ